MLNERRMPSIIQGESVVTRKSSCGAVFILVLYGINDTILCCSHKWTEDIMNCKKALCTLAISCFFVSACKGVDEEKEAVGEGVISLNPQALSLSSGERFDEMLEKALSAGAQNQLFATPANIKIYQQRMPRKVFDGEDLFTLHSAGSGDGDNFLQTTSMPEGQAPNILSRYIFNYIKDDFMGVNRPYWSPGVYLAQGEGGARTLATVGYLPERNMRVNIFEVDDASQPILSKTIKVEGAWKGTQQVGDTLYLWSQYTVNPDIRYELQINKSSIAERDENNRPVKDLRIKPTYTVDGEVHNLTEGCLLPNGMAGNQTYHELINVTAINLSDKTTKSTCLGGSANSFTVSENAAYVSNSYVHEDGAPRTVVHKFSISSSGLEYQATGEVGGALSSQSQPFATGEDVRLVTAESNSTYQLYVLAQDEERLEVISDDLAEESLLSGYIVNVQFHNDRAYIPVAIGSNGFQNGVVNEDDWVQIVNLEDPTQPFVMNTLRTAYYPYIFPLNNRYLLTVGFLYEQGEHGLRNSGVGVSLLDVEAAPENAVTTIPVGDDTIEPTGLETYNIFPIGDDEVRVTFPSGYTSDENEFIYGYQMLEIKGLAADTPALVDAGILVLPDFDWSFTTHTTLRGDDFNVLNSGVWTATWGQPNSLEAAIFGESVVLPGDKLEDMEEAEGEAATEGADEPEQEGVPEQVEESGL